MNALVVDLNFRAGFEGTVDARDYRVDPILLSFLLSPRGGTYPGVETVVENPASFLHLFQELVFVQGMFHSLPSLPLII